MRHLTVTDSDNIEAVGYDLGNAALEVVFKSSPNDVYRYLATSPEMFAKLISADSIGKAFHELFKKTKHPFIKSVRPTLKK